MYIKPYMKAQNDSIICNGLSHVIYIQGILFKKFYVIYHGDEGA